MAKKFVTNNDAIMQLEKEFVPFYIASMMYVQGYDEPCFAHYSNMFANIKAKLIIGSIVGQQEQYHGQICSAPLWQQAIDWLQSKHKLFIETVMGHDDNGIWWDWYIHPIKTGIEEKDFEPLESNEEGGFPDYYKCIEAAIIKALDLIDEKQLSDGKKV